MSLSPFIWYRRSILEKWGMFSGSLFFDAILEENPHNKENKKFLQFTSLRGAYLKLIVFQFLFTRKKIEVLF